MNLINKEVLFIDLDGTVTNTITGDIFPKGIIKIPHFSCKS